MLVIRRMLHMKKIISAMSFAAVLAAVAPAALADEANTMLGGMADAGGKLDSGANVEVPAVMQGSANTLPGGAEATVVPVSPGGAVTMDEKCALPSQLKASDPSSSGADASRLGVSSGIGDVTSYTTWNVSSSRF